MKCWFMIAVVVSSLSCKQRNPSSRIASEDSQKSKFEGDVCSITPTEVVNIEGLEMKEVARALSFDGKHCIVKYQQEKGDAWVAKSYEFNPFDASKREVEGSSEKTEYKRVKVVQATGISETTNPYCPRDCYK